MAERIPIKRRAAAALLALACAAACLRAQTATGSLAGRLTDMEAHPLAGVTVTVRNQQTGAAFVTTSSRSGAYQFTGLSAGDYVLEARSAALGHGAVDGILVSAGHTASVSAALLMERVTEPTAAPPVESAAKPAIPWRPLSAPPPELQPDPMPTAVLGTNAPLAIALQGRTVAPAPAALSTASRPRIETESATLPAALPGQLPPQQTTLAQLSMHSRGIAPPAALPSAALPSRIVLASPLMVQVAIGAARLALRLGAVSPGSLLAADRAGLDDLSGAGVLTAEQLELLPLPNQEWKSLLSGQDPDATTGSSQEQERAAFSGERPGAVSVNGMDMRLAFGAVGTGFGRQQNSMQGLILPVSAIRAVQQVTAMAPGAAGRLGRGGLQVSTRQGGAGRHGQVALFNRQNLWNARNPFAEWVQETVPATAVSVPVFSGTSYTPPDRSLRLEAGLGDRLAHDRVGWYAAVESAARNFPVVASVRHPENFFAQPSNDQMQVLAARLDLPATDPVSEGVAVYSTALEDLAGLLGPAPRTSLRTTGFGRIDWHLSERQQVAAQGSVGRWNSPGGGFNRAQESYGTHSMGVSRGADQWVSVRWQAFVTPNLLAATQGQMRRYRHSAPASQPSSFEEKFNINTWGQLPQMVVDSGYGFSIGNPARFGPGNEPDETQLNAGERIDWAHGRLLLQGGFELSHSRDGDSMLRNRTGTYHYSSVENFISDEQAFLNYGISGQLDSYHPHNCDETGRAWRDADGQLHGLGPLPCYSYYTQTIGPSNWSVSTNQWTSYFSTRWQPAHRIGVTAQMRWQMQQVPAPIDWLSNPDLPLTQSMPRLGSQWAPGISVSWGSGESRLPVVHVGYSMFYGSIPSSTLLSALTQTGSQSGDLKLTMRPTDNLALGGAPPFPYVLAGTPGAAVKPAAVEFAPGYKNSQVHQAALSLEETLPGRVRLEAAAAVSLGRRLPITQDANYDPAVNPKTITYAVVDGNGSGPLKSPTITVPFYANWPSALTTSGFAGRLNENYQQITELFSRANSTWQAASLQLTRNGRSFTLHARYTYAHTADWNPSGSGLVSGSTVFDPSDFSLEYGASDMDVRHAATGFLLLRTHWRLHGPAERALNGWALAATGTYRSGLPFTMHTSSSTPREYLSSGAAIIGLDTGMNGYGGENRVYGVGRNTYRYAPAWKADMRLSRSFDMGYMRRLELLAESFNLFNHRNVTELETVGYTIQAGTPNSLPALTFLTGLKSGQTEFGQPLNVDATDYYRPRQIQFGLRFVF